LRREAEVLASLNHPNIAHIHGLEKFEGIVALVMELVEGPTLADRITAVWPRRAVLQDRVTVYAVRVDNCLEFPKPFVDWAAAQAWSSATSSRASPIRARLSSSGTADNRGCRSAPVISHPQNSSSTRNSIDRVFSTPSRITPDRPPAGPRFASWSLSPIATGVTQGSSPATA
jgi:hypothetical protein